MEPDSLSGGQIKVRNGTVIWCGFTGLVYLVHAKINVISKIHFPTFVLFLGGQGWVMLTGWAGWRVLRRVVEDVNQDETKMEAQLAQLSITGGYVIYEFI